MSPYARILGAAGLVVGLGALAAASSLRTHAQPRDLEVTSDTPEYCLRMLDRLSDQVRLSQSPPPPEVIHLSTEGHRMCDQGQTRAGIMRLRQAWMMMTHPNPPPAR